MYLQNWDFSLTAEATPIIALLLGILENYGWISASEFSKLVAISQITPGPIAINSATFVGYRVAGILGSFFATLGIFVPAFFITMIVSNFFYKIKDNEQFNAIMNALRVCAVALIASGCNHIFKRRFFCKTHGNLDIKKYRFYSKYL